MKINKKFFNHFFNSSKQIIFRRLSIKEKMNTDKMNIAVDIRGFFIYI